MENFTSKKFGIWFDFKIQPENEWMKFFDKLERLAMKKDAVPEKRNDIAMKIVDGMGANRVANEILRL